MAAHPARLRSRERQKRSLLRRIHNARLGAYEPIADFDWSWPTKIDREGIEDLFQLGFVEEAANSVLIGGNGLGKTTIANLLHRVLLAGLLLALAADRHCASLYSRHCMADVLGISLRQVDAALQRLRDLELADCRPWHAGSRDGVWQLLPLSLLHDRPRAQRVLGIGARLASLGCNATPSYAANRQRQNAPPDTGA